MTELRKGQRARLEVEIQDGFPDEDGDVRVLLPSIDVTFVVPMESLRPIEAYPTYLARREAMVREMVASTAWEHTSFAQIVKAADEALRAVDDTPVPEGGEDA